MAINEKKYTYTLEAKYKGSGELGRLQTDLKQLKEVDSMRKLGTDVLELNRRFRDARTELERQATGMRTAGTVTREMSESYRKAQTEVKKLSDQLNRKQEAYRKSREAVKAAGIDTRKLATEEKRLATAAKATGEVWAARRALGVRSHRDVRDEINRMRGAYETLRRSGTLTSTELIQAKRQLNARVGELRTTTNAWAGDLTRVHTGLIGLAGVGYALGRAFSGFSEFETGMAEVYTLVDITKEQFEDFRESMRGVFADLPQENKDLLKAMYDLRSAGVDLQFMPDTLNLVGKAATAGITETQTAAKVGLGVMNAYGMQIGDLEYIYDILFQTVKQGVTTFPELAQSIGDVSGPARIAGIDLATLGASIATLTKSMGGNTPRAVTAMKGAITALTAPAPAAKKAFKELGIEYGDFISTIEQIREKGLSVEQFRMLIPDSEARTGVINLVQGLDGMKETLESMDGAAGSMETAYKKMADTPAHDIALMRKSLSLMGTEIGGLASLVILPTARAITDLASAVNDAPAPIKYLVSAIGAAVTSAALWKLGLGQVVGGIVSMVKWVGLSRTAITGLTATNMVSWLASLRTATLAAAASNTIMATSMKALGAAGLVYWSGSKVVEAVQAYREMREVQRQVNESKRQGEEIEARYQDRLARASAAAGVELASWREVQQAYQDGLIDYDRATDTYTKGAGVRREAHRSVAQAAKESADEQSQATAEVTDEMKEQYRKYVEEVKRLQDQISGRSLSLIEELRGMGRTGMSDLGAWNDLKKEAQEYERAARVAAEAGNFDEAVAMADKAKDRYKQLNTEVKDGDRVLVSQNEALKTAMDGVRRSGELAIEALREQKDAAAEAAKQLDMDSGGKLSKSMEGVVEGVEDVTAAGIEMGDTLVDQINKFGVEAARELDELERRLKMPHKMVIEVERREARASGGMIGMATGGYLAMRNMLRGGHFPGFGGGDRRHVVAEDGEYMFDKHRVRHAGLDVVRAFHAGRYDLVVAGLAQKFKLNLAELIHRKIGGAINRIDNLRVPVPQYMADGGAVVGGGGSSGEVITFNVRIGGSRSFGPFTGPAGDAGDMLLSFQQALEGSS
ncbi:MAG: phage tail tape measure protein [Desulfobulbaceae bacterium]|nr:phage tail tape measure protein [Desulfobulbaceae bacterium]